MPCVFTAFVIKGFPMMNLNHLRIFLAVAEEKSITRGAHRLKLSQPAVSKELRLLEGALELALFQRHSRGLELTREGDVLMGYARRIFGLESEAERSLAEFRGVSRGRVVVGASSTIGVYKFPEILLQFRDRYPNIEVEMKLKNDKDIQESLLERQCDMAYTGGFIEHRDIEAKPILMDELVVITPPGHPAAKKPELRIEQILEYPFVLRELGSGMRAIFERFLASHGLAVKCIMALNDTEAVKRSVALGVGLGVLSNLTVDAEIRRGELEVANVKGFPLQRPIQRLMLRGRAESPAIRAFHYTLAGTLNRREHRRHSN